jgi:hypothetical protein
MTLKKYNFKQYTKFTFFLIFLMLLLITTFNAFMDPFAIFNGPKIIGINANKPVLSTHVRLTKSMAIRSKKPDSIILGNSRAEYGIDPKHPVWGDQKVYNLGLGNASVYEIYRYLQHAQEIQPLKEVVLMLDFVMFNAIGNREKEDFEERRLATDYTGNRQGGVWSDLSTSLLSFDAMVSSVETLFNQDYSDIVYLTNGMIESTFRSAHINGYHESFLVNEKGYFSGPSYQPFSFSSVYRNNWSIYRKIIVLAHKNKIDLKIAISPVHARQLEIFSNMGLWSDFEKWKRQLVSINEKVASNTGKSSFKLLDFSGYNKYTTENLPDIGDHETIMQWYWESSHYKKELGDLVLDDLFEYRHTSRDGDHKFGVQITSKNIDSHLEIIRQEKKTWRKNNPYGVDELNAMKELIH